MVRHNIESLRPFVKWVGGKRSLLPAIRPLVPEKIGCYVEPFCGGAGVFFDLVRQGKIEDGLLADANLRLIQTYQAVRDYSYEVIFRMTDHQAAPPTKEQYLKLRACPPIVEYHEPTSSRVIDVAEWFLLMNRLGYNGLYRVNKRGQFNVPFGSYKNPTFIDPENIRACAGALGNVALVCQDFEVTISRARPGDFVYCDPPYVPVNRTSRFTQYQQGGFGMDDQARLAAALRDAKDRGVSVLTSNSDTPEVRELYRGFELFEVRARRSISADGKKRNPVGELLIR